MNGTNATIDCETESGKLRMTSHAPWLRDLRGAQVENKSRSCVTVWIRNHAEHSSLHVFNEACVSGPCPLCTLKKPTPAVHLKVPLER